MTSPRGTTGLIFPSPENVASLRDLGYRYGPNHEFIGPTPPRAIISSAGASMIDMDLTQRQILPPASLTGGTEVEIFSTVPGIVMIRIPDTDLTVPVDLLNPYFLR